MHRIPLWLRLSSVPVMALLLVGGCSSPSPTKPTPNSIGGTARGTNTPPSIRPLGDTIGRVVQVNVPLRFVVLDFPLNPLPTFGQRLELVRNGEVTGLVKVSSFYRGTSVVADLVEGNAAVDDSVRAK
jgi:hypothetical protein